MVVAFRLACFVDGSQPVIVTRSVAVDVRFNASKLSMVAPMAVR